MKSLELYLQGLYDALFEELHYKFPTSRTEWNRDSSRLHDAVSNHGIKVYTIFLPDICKALDRALADGYIAPLKLPLAGADRGWKSPRLFKGLFQRIFDTDGLLRARPDTDAIRLLRQLLLVAKKLRIECDDSKTHKAVAEFFGIERDIRRPTLNWDEDHLDVGLAANTDLSDCVQQTDSGAPDLFRVSVADRTLPFSVQIVSCIQLCADIVASTLGRFDPADWRTKHGPGAVSDLRGDGSKYSFPNWPEKLDSIFPLDEHAYSNTGVWADEVSSGAVNSRFSTHEPPAKLIAVPKTQKGPRLIASEPTAHQWAQQSVNDFLRSQYKNTPVFNSIHFRDQGFNQEAALQASLDGEMWTIDLSSASDRLTLWLVERMFRRNPSLLTALHASRTRWLINNIDKKQPKYSKLWKLAPQGAAFTFPMQTIVYATIACACLLSVEGVAPTIRNLRDASRRVQVFGDDIIVPSTVGQQVTDILDHLGFKVNRQKTYGNGNFRESCGMDAFAGQDVTPAYITKYPDKARPESIVATVACHNNFALKGLWHVCDYLKTTLLQNFPHLRIAEVPLGSGTFGWYQIFPKNSHLRRRFSKEYQVELYEAHDLVTHVSRREHPGSWSLLQYFIEAPDPEIFWSSGWNSIPSLSLKLRWVNLKF